jgi:hypothetical protein
MTNIDIQSLPVWLQPIELDQWQTIQIQPDGLDIQLRLHSDWELVKEIEARDIRVAHETHYRGKQEAEWCIIHYLPNANLDDSLKEWVESPIKMTGFPIVAMNDAFESPASVMEMTHWGRFQAYKELVGCDAMVAYDGFMRLPPSIGGVAHFYILVLRKETRAWKIELAFHSACLPSSDEDTLNRNDHVRAGASLGYIKLI